MDVYQNKDCEPEVEQEEQDSPGGCWWKLLY